MEETPVDARQYDKAFMLFGSSCRLLAGKIPLKDYRTTLEDLWQWSKKKVEELNHDAIDVPHFDLPTALTLPLPPENGSPDPGLPPPAEKPVKAPDPSPIPTEQVVYIADEQVVRFVAHAYKQGFSEMGLIRYLKSQGINTPSQILLSKARDLWNAVREPALVQEYH
jgi:hypothetical protein